MSQRPISRAGKKPFSVAEPPKLTSEQEYEKWADRVLDVGRKILYALFDDGLMDGIINETMTSDMAYSVWTEAFTSPDVSMVNYDRQEFFGDAISQALFAEYTYSMYPNAGPDQLTELKAHYTDNEVQGELLGDLQKLAGIDFPIEGLIRRNESVYHVVHVDMKNDLYESLFSAIFISGNAYKKGLGYLWGSRFIEVVYDGKIDFEEYSKPSARSRLETMFSSFGYSDNTQRVRKPSVIPGKAVIGNDGVSRITTIVRINADIVAFLNSEFVRVSLTDKQKLFVSKLRSDQIIGQATEMLRKKSKRVAASNALKYIKDNIGLDSKWVKINKERNDNIYINSTYNDLATKVMNDLVKRGYVTESGEANYEVDKLTKFTIDATRTVSRLIGVRPSGKMELLEADAGDGNMMNAKIKLFEKYLAGRV